MLLGCDDVALGFVAAMRAAEQSGAAGK